MTARWTQCFLFPGKSLHCRKNSGRALPDSNPERMKIRILCLSIFLPCLLSAQHIQGLTEKPGVSLRGLSVVSDRIVWVSGSRGHVGKSLDSGRTWQWMQPRGFEKRDFRDIEAFDGQTAVIMVVAEPALILITLDGGNTWKTAFIDSSKGMFLDAMEFWNTSSGIVIGDPVNGRFYIGRTFDGGSSWHQVPFDEFPAADSGEACFAASGTNIRKLNRREACFVSGGARSRLFIRDQRIDIPFQQGRESAGANSVAVEDDRKLKGGLHMVVVGGDFAADSLSDKNCFLTKDGGKTWTVPESPPHGYRSCVEFLTRDHLISCGTTGVDFSVDGGIHWSWISRTGFNVCRKAKKGNQVFLAGNNGRVARLLP
jgi:photosystem II stability/assembly factor-like uncharacterized protein